jgi:two-component system sensor histidine kinase MprB
VTYRTRLLAAVAGAVAVAVALVSVAGYAVTRHRLRSGVDEALRDRTGQIDVRRLDDVDAIRRLLRPRWDEAQGTLQVVSTSGRVRRLLRAQPALPVSPAVLDVARGEREDLLYDAHVRGVHLRVLATGAGEGEALQVSVPLTETDSALRGLAAVVSAIGGLGVLGALVAGLVLARALLRPVRRLTDAAEEVARTQNLSSEIATRGQDELARLGRAFNAMLKALAASRRAQRRLVADASHELRTPLTILRSNLEMLAGDEGYRLHGRRRLLGELAGQTEDLGELVNDLVELGREGIEPDERMPVRLDLLAEAAVGQARRRWPDAAIEAALEPTELEGSPDKLQRAVRNLIDNACKWSASEGPIEVTLRGGRLTVRDHGPGIADADLPRVFDRFYRSPAVRSQPGSGLGLAIVRQVAEAHGGSAYAENAPGGGARFTLELATPARPPLPHLTAPT